MTYGQPGGYGNPPASAKTNTLAIVALVLAFVCSIAGLVTGIIANNQIKASGEQGAGLAKAAIILSSIFIVLGIVYAVVVVGIVGSSTN